mgnify:CR=1 FL=1
MLLALLRNVTGHDREVRAGHWDYHLGGQLRRASSLTLGVVGLGRIGGYLNFNPKTARLYEDVGLLTAAPDIGADLTDLFNSLTGYSRKDSYRNLLVAPHGVRKGIIERIERDGPDPLTGF